MSSGWTWRLIALGGLLALIACRGDDDSGGGGATTMSGTGGQTSTSTGTGGTTGTGTPAGTGGSGTGQGGSACDTPAFVAVAEDAGMYQQVFRYIAQSTLGAPVDVLTFELVAGTPDVETLLITNAGYESCQNCVRLDRQCDAMLANCQKTLLAQAGAIEVTSSGGAGSTFAGTLRDAQFVEVTIDQNLVSTPVEGGERFCSAPYTFNAAIQ